MPFVEKKEETPAHICRLPAPGFFWNKYPVGTLYDCDDCGWRYSMVKKRDGAGRWALVSTDPKGEEQLQKEIEKHDRDLEKASKRREKKLKK